MKLTVKLAFLQFSLFSLFSLYFLNSEARTLQSLAQLSNTLLVLADQAATKPGAKSCNLTSQQISQKSQALQALIDEKTAALTESDFKILISRSYTCDQDCSCDIYGYAFDQHDRPNAMVTDKARKTTTAARKKCLRLVKNACAW